MNGNRRKSPPSKVILVTKTEADPKTQAVLGKDFKVQTRTIDAHEVGEYLKNPKVVWFEVRSLDGGVLQSSDD